MGNLSPIFKPLQTWTVDLPFHPTLWQRFLRTTTKPLTWGCPIPRSEEILSRAKRLGVSTTDLPRRLFGNAFRESLLLLSGGWRQLDLTPLQNAPSTWTQCGRPTLFLSMHHGNWEWLAGILYHLRKDTMGVARAAHQRPGQWLLDHVRSFHRTPVLYNQEGVRAAHRSLRQGGLVAFLADQRPPHPRRAWRLAGSAHPSEPTPPSLVRWLESRDLDRPPDPRTDPLPTDPGAPHLRRDPTLGSTAGPSLSSSDPSIPRVALRIIPQPIGSTWNIPAEDLRGDVSPSLRLRVGLCRFEGQACLTPTTVRPSRDPPLPPL